MNDVAVDARWYFVKFLEENMGKVMCVHCEGLYSKDECQEPVDNFYVCRQCMYGAPCQVCGGVVCDHIEVISIAKQHYHWSPEDWAEGRCTVKIWCLDCAPERTYQEELDMLDIEFYWESCYT